MTQMRFHVLGIPHTVSTPEYSSCAFTQKVVKLCKMLKAQGHHVIHYGHEESVVLCDEHVAVTRPKDMTRSYGEHDWRAQGWPKFTCDDFIYKRFTAKTNLEVADRKQPGDFLLCSFGDGHKPVADANQDMIVCEPGIGYATGGFAKFRIFESYAVMHAYHGKASVANAINNHWYDAVIPNYFDNDDFDFESTKSDYLLFLGRISTAKGIHVAEQIAKASGRTLVVAGAGDYAFGAGANVECVGIVQPKVRRKLLASARAVLCPSTFLEPFCGVQIEAMLSGTPVISSDWGAFAEYNPHGHTGFRCKTFEQFLWAERNIETIDSGACRRWGEQFLLDRVGPRFDDYFATVSNIYNGKGWYAECPERTSLENSSF